MWYISFCFQCPPLTCAVQLGKNEWETIQAYAWWELNLDSVIAMLCVFNELKNLEEPDQEKNNRVVESHKQPNMNKIHSHFEAYFK